MNRGQPGGFTSIFCQKLLIIPIFFKFDQFYHALLTRLKRKPGNDSQLDVRHGLAPVGFMPNRHSCSTSAFFGSFANCFMKKISKFAIFKMGLKAIFFLMFFALLCFVLETEFELFSTAIEKRKENKNRRKRDIELEKATEEIEYR